MADIPYTPPAAGDNKVLRTATGREGYKILDSGTYSDSGVTGIIVDEAGATVTFSDVSENPDASATISSVALAPGAYPIVTNSITVTGKVILILG